MDPQRYEIDWVLMDDEPSPEVRAAEIRKIYIDSKEQIPHDSPEALGRGVDVNVFVNHANHAGNKVTRRSHSGIIIYCNCSPII